MRFLRLIRDIWPSIAAMVATWLVAFLSMGLLGLVLYHVVAPVLNLWYPPLAAWDQSLVWPVIIAMPIVWSPAFILSGLANRYARRQGMGRMRRVALRLAILWLAALAAWPPILSSNPTLWR